MTAAILRAAVTAAWCCSPRWKMPPPRHRLAAFSAKLNSIVAPLRQLHFTYAQGKEMSRHQALDAACGVKVYFCELHLAVATRHLQKHQRLASPVSAQRHRPIGLQSGYQRSAANRLSPALRWWLVQRSPRAVGVSRGQRRRDRDPRGTMHRTRS